MFGLIKIPEDLEESLCMLFFTKEDEANNYIKIFQEKYPDDKTKFKVVKIKKYMIFDAGSEDDSCYYKFDPKCPKPLEVLVEDIDASGKDEK